MWTSRRRVGVIVGASLFVARRCIHSDASAPSSTATASSANAYNTPSTPPSTPSSSKEIHSDDTEAWILAQVQRSVESGRQSEESANYFRSMMHDGPEFHQCLQEARRLIGGQDPAQLTRYQQGQFADRLCNYMSGVASEKLRRVHAEEQTTKRYTQDGTPTGDNYWFEAGNTLASPAVPGYVKDEILRDMQQDRSTKSPAFLRPPEESQMAEADDDYASHLRRQRSKLLSGSDLK